jgi:hypothetical protein
MAPAFDFNLQMQRNLALINDVNPSLILMFAKWESMTLKGEQSRLCELLIKAHKQKFEFELKSSVYEVASLLNISKLYIWYNQSLFADYSLRAANTLSSVVFELNYASYERKESEGAAGSTQASDKSSELLSNSVVSSSNSQKSVQEDDLFDRYVSISTRTQENNHQAQVVWMKAQIELEKGKYLKILRGDLKDIKSTQEFWFKHKYETPHFYKAALKLLNIPASSAFIERYFSICGIINNDRCGNMSSDLLITRSLLKANVEVLDSLAKERL